jgi:hypothetical protein
MNRLLDPIGTESNPDVAPSTDGSNGDVTSPPASTPPPSGRESNGRFAKGNPGGSGNPFARQTAALRRELVESVTAEDIRQIAQRLLQQAKEGDVPSARLLFSYAIGRPAPVVDPDTLDQQEWQALRQQVKMEDANAYLQSVPADTACHYLRQALPMMTRRYTNQLRDIVVERGWPEASLFANTATAPSTDGGNGAEAQTPLDKAARRKQLKKKFAFMAGKVVTRTD